jgi:hypothetical protein
MSPRGRTYVIDRYGTRNAKPDAASEWVFPKRLD